MSFEGSIFQADTFEGFEVPVDFTQRRALYEIDRGIDHIARHVPQIFNFIAAIMRKHHVVCLYGGASRALIRGKISDVRDFDFAVDQDAFALIEDFLKSTCVDVTRNRFGGIRFSLQGHDGQESVSVDCWHIKDTWAFRSGALAYRDWKDLARASVIDIDGAVIRFKDWDRVEVEAEPYMKAMQSCAIDLQLPSTFDWTIALFRTLSLAHSFNYRIEERLQNELALHLDQSKLNGFIFGDLVSRRFPDLKERFWFIHKMLHERSKHEHYTIDMSNYVSSLYIKEFRGRWARPFEFMESNAAGQMTFNFDRIRNCLNP